MSSTWALLGLLSLTLAQPRSEPAQSFSQISLPARYFRLMEVEMAPIEKRLEHEPKIDLKTLEAAPGDRHFPGAILAAAVLYARQHPANPSFGDKKKLELALRIGDLLAGENERGTFQKRLDDDWDMYMWLEAYRLLEKELREERRARWRTQLERNVKDVVANFAPRLDFPRYQSPYIRTSTNHYSLWASTAYLAGRMFGNKEWVDLGARAMHRLAAEEQTPDGFWGEHTDNGPTTGYNHLTMTGVALYWEYSQDPTALQALRRATDFHKNFTYPDGTPVEVINGRNRHWDVSSWGQFGFSNFPDGRRYAEFLTSCLPEGHVGYHALGRLAQDALYYHEGSLAPIPHDEPAYAYEMKVPAGIRKVGPWTVCLSGLIDPPVESQFTLDRQGHLSIFHEKLGLIVTGANSKRQPDIATFYEKFRGQESHMPVSSRLRMSNQRDRLGLGYRTFFTELEIPPPTRERVKFGFTVVENGRMESAQLTLQLCLKAGEELETAKSKVVLTEKRLELKPEEIGGTIKHHGWKMTVDPAARLTWPILPFNPYRNGPETELRYAVGALTVPLHPKPPSPLNSRSQRVDFTMEATNPERDGDLRSRFVSRQPAAGLNPAARRDSSTPGARGKTSAKELPYDQPIRKYLATQAAALEGNFLRGLATATELEKAKPALREDYLDMLGLKPMPEHTPLQATITGRLERPGYTVEMLHFQSSPGLYVTANLYLPHPTRDRLPAILYLCGHYSQMKRDGNKAHPDCQSHAIWFATHGYAALVLDTLELGEIAGMHRGTLRNGRWWWQSAGYTPAGVECWNAVRAIDYLASRPEVDPERIGATGISGGGVVTFWVTAADERVKVAAPVSGMGDLSFYAGEGGIGRHCDCFFLHNRARWDWTTISSLIAPRPLLFVNSDNDVYFPMETNERLGNRLQRLYSICDAGDRMSSVISRGGHGYRTDIRRAVFEFFNRYLKSEAGIVTDADAAVAPAKSAPIPLHLLRVFPKETDLPTDQKNTRIDQTFVARARPELPRPANFTAWRGDLLDRLRKASFAAWPAAVPAPTPTLPHPWGEGREGGLGLRPTEARETTEGGIDVFWRWLPGKNQNGTQWLIVLNPDEEPADIPVWARDLVKDEPTLILCPRGVGPVAWTRNVFPNTVDRSFPLLGATADGGRVWDVMTIARRHAGTNGHWRVAGQGQAGIIGAYGGLYEPAITEVVAVNPPPSHQPRQDGAAYGPVLLNVLRVLDIPEALGCLAPRKLTLIGGTDSAFDRTQELYRLAGAPDRLERK